MRDCERQRRAREAARRRQAVTTLRLAAQAALWTADQAANGLSPAQARRAVVDAAGDLAAAADSLRRLARLRPAERAALARMLSAQGVPGPVIALRLGISQRSVYRYRAAGR